MTKSAECKWPKAPYTWQDNGKLHISIPFTWDLPEVRRYIEQVSMPVIVGGPAVRLLPDYLEDVAEIGTDCPGILQKINPCATRTTIGCPNKCKFCAVPVIEGGFQELEDWPDGTIICDNNLLAASRPHFDKVIDRLKGKCGVDFNQGLDAAYLTQYCADRLAELDCLVRLAWDRISDEHRILAAVTKLRKAGIPRSKIRCYVLIGYNDTPEDALYRLETLRFGLRVDPNPMRYTPIYSLEREYVAESWTEKELTRYMRYWSNLRGTAGVPFAEFEG